MLPYVRIEGFLDQAGHGAVLAWTLAQENAFKPSLVDYTHPDRHRSDDTQLRKSLSRGLDPDIRKRLVPRFRAELPAVWSQFGMRPFEHVIETEMVAYGDGDHFGRHIDTAGTRVLRMVSAVYYCFREPRAFAGGELLLHPLGPGDPVVIVPEQNMLVVFPSFAPHEVLPVRCPSRRFADSRFAINLWVHRVPVPPVPPPAGG